jgi:transcriptional regulator with XRE-family HTH domain
MNTIGKIIKTARLNMGLTQEELANKVGVQKSAIAKWENGRVSEIKRSNLKALADTLGLDPNVLLGEDDECFTGSSKTLTLVPPAKSASAPQHAPDLPPDEQRLLDIYRGLNPDGKTALLEYADLISSSDKYKKAQSSEPDCV